MKEQLITFLKGRNTTFTVEEVNQVINIVSVLEEPSAKEAEAKQDIPTPVKDAKKAKKK